ncbi:dolichol-phosphate hexosyltransferase [Bathymodiolus japonicus methanotrophic gill symbiont]|uniref:glycosyltransferase family 2 protein n=1 Tax=Bathymodiolus japonicus methanotrophic gill symbiont TaxID=113269 RepID=UPI001B3E42C3|nr:glycosyltransferase family 2 protein [Bathymodiolus japonicus methanotrophic gill symbiont]GFO71290.1 dolichol-phosphate hexosyltransferase [Bathymodiolus japonicus methanotrophic gill symbiont]
MELTILMPCLNEAETLAVCIEKAHSFIKQNNIVGEVVIADNGSTDGSIEIAESLGVRVVHVPMRGYGAALQKGIEEAKGEFVIMGDSDDSYDFSNLMPYVEQLRAGYDLVMGNRFKGGIAKGAMPFLHKYLGNPVLSFLGRLFFKIPVGDFHCGLRGFRRDTALSLGLTTPGMEYASELVVRMALAGGSIKEVPTTLSKDGRSRPPHLNTWQDGWRHLRFLLMFSPRWLFFYPSLFILLVGVTLTVLLAQGAVHITPTITLDIHSMIVGCFCVLVGMQGVSFAIVARRYAALRGFLPFTNQVRYLVDAVTLERVLIVAAIFFLGGLGGLIYCVSNWFLVHLGVLEYGSLVRVLMLSGTSVAIAVQLAFTSFLAEILEIKSNIQYQKDS